MSFLVNPNLYNVTSSPATFVGETTNIGSTITLHGSAAVGDIGIIHLAEVENTPGVSGGGGSWTSGGVSANRWFWRVLTAGDLGVSLTLDPSDSSAITALVFRGCSTVTQKYADTGANSLVNSITLTGFTRAGNHKGVVSFSKFSNQNSNGVSGFTNNSQSFGTNWGIDSAYRVDDGYVSGTNVTWNFSGIVVESYGLLLELT